MTTPLPDGLGAPATRALTAAGATSVEDLAGWSEEELTALHGVGPGAVAALRATLARTGRSLRPQRPTDEVPAAITAWLEQQEPEHRRSLTRLRAALLRILPYAQEDWSYGMPALRLQGTAVVGYGAAQHHCLCTPMSGTVLRTMGDAVAGYTTSEGVLRFAPGSALPVGLLRAIVATRIAELSDVRDGYRREHHKDGRVRAEGPMKDGAMHGQWYWYRADGSLLRSGRLTAGEPSGAWVTYLRDGTPVG